MTTQPRPALLRPAFLLCAAYLTALAAATALPPTPAAAQEAAPGEEGIFLTVPNPITGSDSTNRLKESIERALREKRVRKIVFDFNPDGKEASSRDFGPCSDLAKELAKLPVITVAFVHNRAGTKPVNPAFGTRIMSPSTFTAAAFCAEAGMASADKRQRIPGDTLIQLLTRPVVEVSQYNCATVCAGIRFHSIVNATSESFGSLPGTSCPPAAITTYCFPFAAR